MNARTSNQARKGQEGDGSIDSEPNATARALRRMADDATASHAAPLAELAEAHEQIDWRQVSGISTAEAGAWVARLNEAATAGVDY